MTTWHDALARAGMSTNAASLAATEFARVETAFAALGTTAAPAAWWVPGRIEVLGKHTDYGGGRSLLCTVERGFHILSAPRPDTTVRIVDVDDGATASIPLAASTPSQPGAWVDYPVSVIRRLARDAGAGRGADIVFSSSLPRASGLSSSSALVIGTYLALAHANDLDSNSDWRERVGGLVGVAGYLGAVENGKAFGPFAADQGVGTHGGSEDQTAILCCEPGRLSQYRFLPVEHERTVSLPDGWTFAVAMSGIHAEKGGSAQQRYNTLAAEVAALLSLWNERTGSNHVSLLTAIESRPDAVEELLHWTEADGADGPRLARRLRQFAAESLMIVPDVVDHIARADVASIGAMIGHSQALAESTLQNQIPETVALVQSAIGNGAVAASAFGAGFGGSVWAIVRIDDAAAFVDGWRQRYTAAFPACAGDAEFFTTRPGPPATMLHPGPVRP